MEKTNRTAAAAPTVTALVEGTGAGDRAAAAAAAPRVCCLCNAVAEFRFDGEDLPSLCERHQPIDRVQALAKPCFKRGCPNRVSYGWKRESDNLYSCAAHAKLGMVQMRGVPCELPGCRFRPSYAQEGELQARRCRMHAESGFVIVVHRAAGRAEEAEKDIDIQEQQRSACNQATDQSAGVLEGIIPTYAAAKRSSAAPGGGSTQLPDNFHDEAAAAAAAAAMAVATLAGRGGVNMPEAAMGPMLAGSGGGDGGGGGGGGQVGESRNRKRDSTVLTCESPLCNKNPSFAHRGQTRRRFCKRHAEPGMLNVYYKYCDAVGDEGRQCAERASYESPGKLRCLRHCEPGMRARNNICQVEGGGCARQSSYGVEGGKPVLCTVHKKAGMVQVRTKTCKHPGCEKIPSYGFPYKSREYCKPHALKGMIHSAGIRCRFRGCGAPGAFNYPWSARGGSFCSEHKEEGMLDSTPKQCESTGCNYMASYGDTTQRTRRFCARHKLGGMLSYQELWPRPSTETRKAKASTTSAEASTPTSTVAAAAAAAAASITGRPSSTVETASPTLAHPAATEARRSVSPQGRDEPGLLGEDSAAAGSIGATESRREAALLDGAAESATTASAAGPAGNSVAHVRGGAAAGSPSPVPAAQTLGTSAGDATTQPGNSRKAQRSSGGGGGKRPRTAGMPTAAELVNAPQSSSHSRSASAALFSPGSSHCGLARAWHRSGHATARFPGGDDSAGGNGAAVWRSLAPAPVPAPVPAAPASAAAESSISSAAADLAFLADAAVTDLEFLADAAVAAAPTPGVAGLRAAHSFASATGLRAGGPPLTTATPAAVAAADGLRERAPIPTPTLQEFLGIGEASGGDSSPSLSTAGDTSRERTSSSLPRLCGAAPAPFPPELDLGGGIEKDDAEETDEEAFIACLVNSIDPSNPKTLRVRGAVMSRLKGVNRGSVPS